MSEPTIKPRLFCTDHQVIPLPEGHEFPVDKYGILRRFLGQKDFFRLEPAPPAEREIVELAHDGEYVRSFLRASLASAAMRRIGFPWSDEGSRGNGHHQNQTH